MNYTLLIWEENPTAVHLYLIPEEVAQKYTNYLEQAHNKMINSDDDNDGMKFLNTALYGGKDWGGEFGFEAQLGIFSTYKHDLDTPVTDKTITRVYKSGFLL